MSGGDPIGDILDLLERTWRGPAWHGPSVLEALEGVDAEAAGRRPVPGGHTIAELAEHIAVWQDAVREALDGGDGTVSAERDFGDRVAPDAAGWARARARLQASHEALRERIRACDPARLDETHARAGVPWSAVLHGVIHHGLYHAGQIAMLRRAARS